VTVCLTRCLSLIEVGVVRLDGAGDISVEVLFPEVPKRFELGSSGWPWVLGVDAVGGPHTAMSPMSAVFGWLARGAQTG
jgi:hypothetical protein